MTLLLLLCDGGGPGVGGGGQGPSQIWAWAPPKSDERIKAAASSTRTSVPPAMTAPKTPHLAGGLTIATATIALISGGGMAKSCSRADPSPGGVETHASRVAAQHQLVVADLPALQPVEEAHPQEARPQVSGSSDQRRHGTLENATDGDAVKRHRRRMRASIGGIDFHRVVEHFERQSSGFGGFLGQND